MKLRPEVQLFSEAMEERLRANDHKGGWDECGTPWLLKRLRDEVNELAGVVNAEPIPYRGGALAVWRGNALHEAADVANFAMMIADVSGALRAEADDEAGEEG